MKSVYMVMHQQKPNVRELAERVSGAFHRAGIALFAESWLCELTQDIHLFDGCTMEGCEAVIAVGGDGTLLRANALALEHDLPVLGVNIGRVGFLTEVEMDQLEEACEALRQDAFTVESRMMLRVDMEGYTALALNDVVLSRGVYARLIGVDAWVGSDPIGHFMADGLIVSTPTGSTGYSLSAGGPIVCPEVECMVLSPICAHSLQHRPVVTSASQPVSIRLDGEGVEAVVSVDGQETFPFRSGQRLNVTRSNRSARFIRLQPKSFFSKIRIKLSEWSC